MTPAGTSNELDIQNEWEEITTQHTHTHNRAIRPCHPSHSMPLALILPRGYVCIMYYSLHFQQSMDQPRMVANSACGQLNKESHFFPLSPSTPENLVSSDGFGFPAPRQPAYSFSTFIGLDLVYVCMYVWSSHIAEYGSTGKGCQSCSWSAEQGK